jgi:hypothetical protein
MQSQFEPTIVVDEEGESPRRGVWQRFRDWLLGPPEPPARCESCQILERQLEREQATTARLQNKLFDLLDSVSQPKTESTNANPTGPVRGYVPWSVARKELEKKYSKPRDEHWRKKIQEMENENTSLLGPPVNRASDLSSGRGPVASPGSVSDAS